MMSSLHFYTDPDDARDLRFEDEHDERYGERAMRGPDPADAAAVAERFRARYAEAMS